LPTQEENEDWGWKQWAVRLNPDPKDRIEVPLLEMVIDGMMQIPDFQCRQILRERYYRLQPILPEPIRVDDVDKLDRLIEIAYAVELQEAFAWLETHF